MTLIVDDDLEYEPEDYYDEDDCDDDIRPLRDEPDYSCWTCEDIGVVLGQSGDGVNCPACRPTARQRRRSRLVDAWWARKWNREFERRIDGLIDDGAPF